MFKLPPVSAAASPPVPPVSADGDDDDGRPSDEDVSIGTGDDELETLVGDFLVSESGANYAIRYRLFSWESYMWLNVSEKIYVDHKK